MTSKTHTDNTIGWPTGVKREEYKAWKQAQEAKGVTENLNAQEYKRQRDLGLVAGVPASEPVTAVVPAAPAIEATVVPFEEPTGPLTSDEQRRFAELERTIEQNMAGFMRVGMTLLEISQLKLYREDYDTWEDYLEERWGFGQAQGYFMIEAAEVTTNLQQLASGCPLPTAPSQVRGMGELPPEDQAAVWKEACSRVGGDLVPPARIVKEVLDEHRARMAPPEEGGKRRRGRPLKSEAAQDAANEPEDDEGETLPTDEMFTPEVYAAAVRAVLGTIELDPASCDEANAVIGAVTIYTAEQDGLAQDWCAQTLYCNPPYSRGNVDRFVSKLLVAYEDQSVAEAILLVNAATGASWFAPLFQFPCCFVKGRIPFIKSKALQAGLEKKAEERGTAVPRNGNYDSVFVYLGPNVYRFAERFAEFGTIVSELSV